MSNNPEGHAQNPLYESANNGNFVVANLKQQIHIPNTRGEYNPETLKPGKKYKIKVTKIVDSEQDNKEILAITIHDVETEKQLTLPIEVNEKNKNIITNFDFEENIYETIDDKKYDTYNKSKLGWSTTLPEDVKTCIYETDFKRPGQGQLYKKYFFKNACPPHEDILKGTRYKNPPKKLHNVVLHKFTPDSKKKFCDEYGFENNPKSICYKPEQEKGKSPEREALKLIRNPTYINNSLVSSVVGGKKRKRKTVRKSKKSKSVRKHKKTGKKHAKRHSKTMKRKGKQHHKRSKTQRRKSRK